MALFTPNMGYARSNVFFVDLGLPASIKLELNV